MKMVTWTSSPRDSAVSWHENRLAGDANDDGEVSFVDFLALSANYSQSRAARE
jgi:hypothetical protein